MARPIDPFKAFNFILSIDGMASSAGFSEVSGLSTDGDIVEYREGNDTQLWTRKLTGLRKHSHITLKRGQTKNLDLWQWRQNILDGVPDRRAGTITLVDEQNTPVMHWKFREGWPVKYDGPTLNAKGNDVAIETLEIVHEHLEIEAV
ncbi:MAG TPA: phage tail protein [Candidatus Baltobacteraceae bacterium]|nr:phage tail protein [Candidatus Baltobacteraceae bacterium]